MTIDVTELLTDPDFVTFDLTAISRAQAVNDAGRTENTEVRTTFSGVVFPGTGNMMLRTPDGERVTGDISIVTRYHLTDGIGQGRTADVVEYAGGRYIVKNTFDYSNWGRGFVMAVCDMLPVGGI